MHFIFRETIAPSDDPMTKTYNGAVEATHTLLSKKKYKYVGSFVFFTCHFSF